MNAIETFHLSKTYKGKTAVNSIHLTVKQGELFALLGVNGAGKAAIAGRYSDIGKPLLIVIVYAAVIFAIAVIVFKRKMNSDN